MGLRDLVGLRSRRFDHKLRRLGLKPSIAPNVLTEFCSSLRDQHCIVFGSAPNPSFPEYQGQPVICCNGSSASLLKLFGLQPTYSFLNCHVLGRRQESDQEVREVLGGVKHLGRTVIFDEAGDVYSTELIDDRHSAVMSVAWEDRHQIVADLLGVSLPFLKCSTGAITAACVLRAGARSVQLVGFSFEQKGHSYNVKDRYRNHVRSDAALLALLAQAGHPISSPEPSVAVILTDKID